MDKDEYLLVSGRAANEHNAFFYDITGQCIHSFPVGDLVTKVQVSSDSNEIWISYSDEGDYSGSISGTEGLMSFQRDGTPTFRFNSDAFDNAPCFVPYISRCYAINVALDGDVWLYYYPERTLARLHQGTVKSVWNNLSSGGGLAFAVTDDRVLFSGGYNETGRLHLMPLYQTSDAIETIVPVDANGNTLIRTHRLFARDSRLYLLRENDLFVLDLHIHL